MQQVWLTLQGIVKAVHATKNAQTSQVRMAARNLTHDDVICLEKGCQVKDHQRDSSQHSVLHQQVQLDTLYPSCDANGSPTNTIMDVPSGDMMQRQKLSLLTDAKSCNAKHDPWAITECTTFQYSIKA